MKRTRVAAALLSALAVLSLAACSGANSLPGASGGGDAGLAAPDRLASDASKGAAETADRSIIRTGSLSLEVSSPAKAADEIETIVSGLGGSVASQSIAQRGGTAVGGSVSVRVPVDRFDEAFEKLAAVGAVQREDRSALDVTAEHVDLRARVDALEVSVARLTELMRGAASTGDLLAAESALSERQQELDGLKAQLKALEGEIEQATIWIELSVPQVLPGGGPTNFGDAIAAGVKSLGDFGLAAFIAIGFLLPWLLVLAVIAAAIVVPLRIRARKRAAALASAGALGGVAAGASAAGALPHDHLGHAIADPPYDPAIPVDPIAEAGEPVPDW